MHRLFLFWLLFVTTFESKQYVLTTIKFKTFQDYFVKFKDFKALNLVQSNSRFFKTPYGLCTMYSHMMRDNMLILTVFLVNASYGTYLELIGGRFIKFGTQ